MTISIAFVSTTGIYSEMFAWIIYLGTTFVVSSSAIIKISFDLMVYFKFLFSCAAQGFIYFRDWTSLCTCDQFFDDCVHIIVNISCFVGLICTTQRDVDVTPIYVTSHFIDVEFDPSTLILSIC